MSVYKDKKTNTYRVVYRSRDSITLTFHQCQKRGFATRKEAQKFDIDQSNKPYIQRNTFNQVLEEYLSSLTCNDETRIKRRAMMRDYMDSFKDKEMIKITKPLLIKWGNDLKKDHNLSVSSINGIFGLVKGVFKYANEIYDIPNNALILKNEKAIKKEEKQNVWTIEEFNQFIDKVDNPIYKAYFHTLFFTGLRRGEAIALQKDDLIIDNENRAYLNITKSKKHQCEGFHETKTKKHRKISIDDNTRKILSDLKYREGSYLFGDHSSLGITEIDRQFKKGIKLSGVKKIRLHDLRHSHATILINNGMNIVGVSKRLGHSSIEMTLNIYTHLLDKTDKEIVSYLNGISN